MKKKERNNDIKAEIIYKAAVDEEKEWLKENKNSFDILVLKQLLDQIQKLGYRYKYFVDITNRENDDIELLKLLSTYIGKFQDEYFSARIVEVIGKRGNVDFTEIILNHYNLLSNDDKRMHGAFYDNALSRIRDKRYLSNYIELLKSTDGAKYLPLTMVMLGKWQTEAAKKVFLDYLNKYELYLTVPENRTLIFVSLESLSCYSDIDGVIMKTLEDMLKVSDKDLQCSTQKAIKRLESQSKRQSGDGSMIES